VGGLGRHGNETKKLVENKRRICFFPNTKTDLGTSNSWSREAGRSSKNSQRKNNMSVHDKRERWDSGKKTQEVRVKKQGQVLLFHGQLGSELNQKKGLDLKKGKENTHRTLPNLARAKKRLPKNRAPPNSVPHTVPGICDLATVGGV